MSSNVEYLASLIFAPIMHFKREGAEYTRKIPDRYILLAGKEKGSTKATRN